MPSNRLLLSFLLCSLPFALFAQKKNESYRYKIKPATSTIRVDGLPDDLAWKDAQLATNFFMITPLDTSFARTKTEVRMAFDQQNIYIVVVNYKPVKGTLVVESLKRDFNFGKNDNFIFFLDPFDDQTNGFSFGSNAAGGQWDGQQANGGQIDLSWDNKWISETRNYEDRWVWEAAIPFKSIRYKSNQTRWGVNFSRLDLSINEKSAWAPVPRQFPSSTLAYTGVLEWDTPPPSPRANVSLIPYVLGGLNKNYEKNTNTDYRRDVGGDAKIALTSSLNLDLTVNPDFSQVDVDRQQTNLDRFELFFPERRQFFLENADLFSSFGYSTLRPFFSRRIGLGVPIQFGARLSGKLNRDWRVGALNMQTRQQGDLPSQNFAVVALQRRVLARSNVGLLMINKESLNYDEVVNKAYSRYNRNVGAEFNLASQNNFWTGKALILKSFSPNVSGDDWVQAGSLNFNTTKWSVQFQAEHVGQNYNAEVGFVPNATRRGYYKIAPQVGYLKFVKSKKLLSHGPIAGATTYWNKEGKMVDNETFVGYQFNFLNRASGTLFVGGNKLTLQAPFDPTNSGRQRLDGGSLHSWMAFGSEFTSSPQRPLTFAFSTRYGGYYADGTRLGLTGEIGYRYQPYVAATLSANYNRIVMPSPWNTVELWLIGPRVDVTFSNKLFFATFLQYNNQAKNVNLNTRLQWRYKPASDLFIVYTDNYLPENFSVKNRALVIKLTYWLNV